MNDAREALKFFRKADACEDIEDELQTIFEDARKSVSLRVATTRDTFRYPRPLMIGCGIVFLQQVTGQPSVLYFATNIFKDAGFGSWAALPSVGLGFVKLIATLVTVFRVDKYGRRRLLFIGIGMMFLSLAILGTAFVFQECQTPGTSIKDCDQSDIGVPQPWASVTAVALMLYVSGYQVGFGPISWLLISEVFPLNVRGSALSLAAIVNFSTNILMTLTLESLQEAITISGVFFGYCALTVVSIIFVWGVVPETRGKSLEEIDAELTGRGKKEEPQEQITSQTSQTSQSLVSNHSQCSA